MTEPIYRIVVAVRYRYCAREDLIEAIPTGHDILQVRHVCGKWALAPPDGKFCQGCGARLHPELNPRGAPDDA